jgi:hypothetical protein
VSQREDVIELVGAAIDEVNEVRPPKERIPKGLDSPLLGQNLESLTAVSLVVGLDERVQDRYGISIRPVEALAIPPAESPLRTVSTLIEYLMSRISEGG